MCSIIKKREYSNILKIKKTRLNRDQKEFHNKGFSYYEYL